MYKKYKINRLHYLYTINKKVFFTLMLHEYKDIATQNYFIKLNHKINIYKSIPVLQSMRIRK